MERVKDQSLGFRLKHNVRRFFMRPRDRRLCGLAVVADMAVEKARAMPRSVFKNDAVRWKRMRVGDVRLSRIYEGMDKNGKHLWHKSYMVTIDGVGPNSDTFEKFIQYTIFKIAGVKTEVQTSW